MDQKLNILVRLFFWICHPVLLFFSLIAQRCNGLKCSAALQWIEMDKMSLKIDANRITETADQAEELLFQARLESGGPFINQARQHKSRRGIKQPADSATPGF